MTENPRSDADADVLADYVLALLNNANDDTNVAEVFDAEITPFLKEGMLSCLFDVEG